MPSPILQSPAARRFEDMAFLDNTNTNQKNTWHFIKTHPKTMGCLALGLATTAGVATGVCLKVPAAKEFMNNVGTEIGKFASTYEGQVAIAGILLAAATLGLGIHQEVTALADSKNPQLKAIEKFARNIEINETGERVRIKANGPYPTQTAYHLIGSLLPFNKVTYGKLTHKANTAHYTDPEQAELRIKFSARRELQHQLDLVQMRKLVLAAAMLGASGGLLGAAIGALDTGLGPKRNAAIGTVAGLVVGAIFFYAGAKALPELRNKIAVSMAPMERANPRESYSRTAHSQPEEINSEQHSFHDHEEFESIPLISGGLPAAPQSTYSPNSRTEHLDPQRRALYQDVYL